MDTENKEVEFKDMYAVHARYDEEKGKVILSVETFEDDGEIDIGEVDLCGSPENFNEAYYENDAIECAHSKGYKFDEEQKCVWCDDFYDESEMKEEVNLGWLCSDCIAAIYSRGERMAFYTR